MIKINSREYDSVTYVADEEMRKSLQYQAQVAAKAGALPPGVDNEWGYILLVLAGIDMGLLPTRAVATLHLLSGKVSLSAQAMMGLANVAGVRMRVLQYNDEIVEAEFTREGYATHITSFTIEEAKKAGLVRDKSAWVKTPKDMLLARTVTRGLRYIAADIVTGLYSTEELNDGIETVEMSPELRAKADTRDVDLNKLAAEAIDFSSVPHGTEAMPQAPAPRPVIEKPAGITTTQAARAFGGGKVVDAKLDLTQGQYIPLTLNGKVANVAVTSAAIFKAFQEVYGDQAKSVLGERVASYGAANAGELSPIDFLDLYRWADGQVAAHRVNQAVEAPMPADPDDHELVEDDGVPENPEHPVNEVDDDMPPFDPHRGAATKQGGKVEDSKPAAKSLDDQIIELWNTLAEQDKDVLASEVFSKYAYKKSDPKMTQQTRRLVLKELQEILAA